MIKTSVQTNYDAVSALYRVSQQVISFIRLAVPMPDRQKKIEGGFPFLKAKLSYIVCRTINNILKYNHGVGKLKKNSHSTLRAKRATFTFWVDKIKMPKMVNFFKPENCWKCDILSNFQTPWLYFRMLFMVLHTI